MWPRRDLLDLLGIEHPIIQAPMASASTPELVAAVSNAGGLGCYGAAATPPAKLRQVIDRIRALTDQPFLVNLFAPDVERYRLEPGQQAGMAEALAPWHEELGAGKVPEPVPTIGPFAEQAAVLLEARIPLFSFHFGPPPVEVIERMHALGTKVLASATTVREAKILAEAGVDAVIAQGAEAGGHRGTFALPWQHAMIGTLALVPQIVDAVPVPVIAAGGIMDARGVAAAMALGASGVQMGSAFLACPENSIPAPYKQALLAARDEHTLVTDLYSGRPARAIRTRYVEEMEVRGERPLPFPLQASVLRSLRDACVQGGRPDFISMWAGQGAGLARARPAGELVAQLVRDYEALVASLRVG